MKKKREKPEDFIGWKSSDGKLEVRGIIEKSKNTTFKVTCTECSKDPELFPEGKFISRKWSLVNGQKPCGCSNKPKWFDWQYLILARRAGEKKGFAVHGFAEEFKNQRTKLNLECLKDGHKNLESRRSTNFVFLLPHIKKFMIMNKNYIMNFVNVTSNTMLIGVQNVLKTIVGLF